MAAEQKPTRPEDRYGLEKGIRDAVGVMGLAMVCTGLWLVDMRLALVVTGAMLLLGVALGSLRGRSGGA